MTRVFLAAGVAALAISAPASAERGGQHDRGGQQAEVQKSRAERPQRAERAQRAERPQRAERAQRAERPQRAERSAMRAERPQREERAAMRAERPQRAERAAMRAERPQHAERAQRAERLQRADRPQRVAERQQSRAVDRANTRNDRARAVEQRMADRRDMSAKRAERVDDRMMDRRDARADRIDQRGNDRVALIERRNNAFRNASATFPMAHDGRRHALIDGCPPGLWMKNNGCMPPGQAAKLIGSPLAAASSLVSLRALPDQLQYLYPDTSDSYYRYGDGYLYQVNRDSNLISSLLPLIGGGYVPGQYLPNYYMSSYVPNDYGFNNFYQDSSYDCNRYANGVVYQVDCYTGMIQGVVPLYANGYGYGQMLPSAYNYYNVPNQYRSLYYDTADSGYWYAPGAIYQYDRQSSLITSVAALLSPGFAVGQSMPMGYDSYNVPYDYRATYYDTPDASYRYNNGNIYRVDPKTQLVAALVASVLT